MSRAQPRQQAELSTGVPSHPLRHSTAGTLLPKHCELPALDSEPSHAGHAPLAAEAQDCVDLRDAGCSSAVLLPNSI